MMLSMTAFSRQQLEQEWGSLTWEIRSVNHRYLEASVRLPESFRSLENSVRGAVRKKLSRGKVECQLRFQSEANVSTEIHLNHELIRKLIGANVEIEQITGTSTHLGSVDILRWPGVIQDQDFDNALIEKQALELFTAALDDLIATREREGAELKGFLEKRIKAIREIVTAVQSKMPDILAKQKQNILDRVDDLKVELEPARLEQEVSLLAQKADVEEELDRLNSHLNEVERVINTGGQKGRRLDFLMQELNREANTLSSKSIVAETTLSAVELKVLIEQMREQIQNVE
ncbi:MAG: YicC family protein [SAR86 cluster bacterium]|uniref:YicC family protein n=1 Tax=SAR86 cluster bacterium TaxID=2030880 RepID=A0A2A5B0Y0_9GAMM|nr:MAG: YicC family protein [SAR86 cluster bacterium]